jgi:hypothetical protein
MNERCETCSGWTGRVCENEASDRYCHVTGAGWTCNQYRFRFATEGFGEFLAKWSPRKGAGRGGRHRLAKAVGVEDMRVHHWISGESVPHREWVPTIAAVVGRTVEEVEAMIVVDIHRRAEQNWRSKEHGE